ncbi:MAG: NADH-quinone oxidoreductase subunit NuoE [Caldilineaceae bacterium]|nr:NADH-quinone oxidoreductase subunit NuoE [Caldilineaceae bacterium]
MASRSKLSFRKRVYRGDPLNEPPPAELAEIIQRHKGAPDALITAMEEIQRHYGYLAADHLRYLARDTGVPLARIYGIATFYNFFRLNPPGEHVIRICRGTACHVNNSAAILEALRERLGVDVGETSADGQFTLLTVACVGACSLAPVVVVDEETHGRMTAEDAWAALAAATGEATQEERS